MKHELQWRGDARNRRCRLLLTGLFVGFFALSTACASYIMPDLAGGVPEERAEEYVDIDALQRFEGVPVQISANGDGQYLFVSDIELRMGQFGVEDVYIDQPTLLSYAVSSAYADGAWVLDGAEAEQLRTHLTRAQELLTEQCSPQAAEEIAAALAQLDAADLYTQSST